MSGHFGLHTWERVEKFGLTAASPQTEPNSHRRERRRKRTLSKDKGTMALIHHLSISTVSHGTEEIQVRSTITYVSNTILQMVASKWAVAQS